MVLLVMTHTEERYGELEREERRERGRGGEEGIRK